VLFFCYVIRLYAIYTLRKLPTFSVTTDEWLIIRIIDSASAVCLFCGCSSVVEPVIANRSIDGVVLVTEVEIPLQEGANNSKKTSRNLPMAQEAG